MLAEGLKRTGRNKIGRFSPILPSHEHHKIIMPSRNTNSTATAIARGRLLCSHVLHLGGTGYAQRSTDYESNLPVLAALFIGEMYENPLLVTKNMQKRSLVLFAFDAS